MTLDADARALVERTTKEQRIPLSVTDRATLATVAAIVSNAAARSRRAAG